MGEAAVLVAKSCDYLGAGTRVEFLLDENLNFFFGNEYAFCSRTSSNRESLEPV
jgi:hypothetical protein